MTRHAVPSDLKKGAVLQDKNTGLHAVLIFDECYVDDSKEGASLGEVFVLMEFTHKKGVPVLFIKKEVLDRFWFLSYTPPIATQEELLKKIEVFKIRIKALEDELHKRDSLKKPTQTQRLLDHWFA